MLDALLIRNIADEALATFNGTNYHRETAICGCNRDG
jgi:hypothetical protein